ncbi:MAG: hypothetical protein ACXWP0_04340, partial [Ktedonobacterales bacterium]
QMATGAYERLHQLQDENARLREIVQELAHRPLSYNPVLIPPRFQCNHCDASTSALEVVDGRIYQVTSDMAAPRVQHLPDCPVTNAHTLLSKSNGMEVSA